MKTFTLNAKEVTINYSYEKGKVSLAFNAEPDDVAEMLTVAEVVAHFDSGDLLEVIGIENAKAWFGLVE